MQNETRAYFYVYDFDKLGRRGPEKISEPIADGRVTLTGLEDGTYTVEFWDTLAGTISQQTTLEVTGGVATIALPPVSGDLAAKVKKQ